MVAFVPANLKVKGKVLVQLFLLKHLKIRMLPFCPLSYATLLIAPIARKYAKIDTTILPQNYFMS